MSKAKAHGARLYGKPLAVQKVDKEVDKPAAPVTAPQPSVAKNAKAPTVQSGGGLSDAALSKDQVGATLVEQPTPDEQDEEAALLQIILAQLLDDECEQLGEEEALLQALLAA